jgi:hypothetical protein
VAVALIDAKPYASALLAPEPDGAPDASDSLPPPNILKG